jgi:hypothetical protein
VVLVQRLFGDEALKRQSFSAAVWDGFSALVAQLACVMAIFQQLKTEAAD